jgi:ribosome biogenesis protein MAK21
MKGIVVREMTSLVFRASTSTAATAPGAKGTHIRFDDAAPSQSTPKSKPKDKAKTKADDTKPGAHGNPHAAYYATITFNQIVLSPSPADRAVARQLVDIYFTFFRELLGEGSIAAELDEEKVPVIDGNDNLDDGKKGGKGKAKGKGRASQSGEGGAFAEVEDSNSRHISAILTGVNRALPFAKLTMNDAGFVQFACHRAYAKFVIQLWQAHRHPLPDHAYLDLQHQSPSSPAVTANFDIAQG